MKNNFILIAIAFFVFGCKTSKEIANESERVRSLSSNKVISNVGEGEFEYSNIFIKKFDGKIEFGDSKFSFKGAMYIERDSQIVISIMPLMGIELFKAYISPKEIILIDKTKKQVLIGDIAYLKTKFNIDFGFKGLQSALTNQIYGFDQDCAVGYQCLKTYRFDNTKDSYIFQNISERRLNRFEKEHKAKLDFLEFEFSNISFRLKNFYLKDLELDSELKLKYSDFEKISDFLFPYKLEITGRSQSKSFIYQMEIGQIERNSNNEISFKIPEKFEKVYIK
ncbi:MAG: DUF4292 domain-containing protein [Breznakibacter sp.]